MNAHVEAYHQERMRIRWGIGVSEPVSCFKYVPSIGFVERDKPLTTSQLLDKLVVDLQPNITVEF